MAGLLNYPVLMVADILLYKTNLVPVGEDQLPAYRNSPGDSQKFNSAFGGTFPIPEPLLNKEGKRIMGLDDPAKKMSKSAENPNNYIALLDSPETIREKIKSAVTDSGSEIKYDAENKPAISNLLLIYSLFSGLPADRQGKSIPILEKEYAGKNYFAFKKIWRKLLLKACPLFRKIQRIVRQFRLCQEYFATRNRKSKDYCLSNNKRSSLKNRIFGNLININSLFFSIQEKLLNCFFSRHIFCVVA